MSWTWTIRWKIRIKSGNRSVLWSSRIRKKRNPVLKGGIKDPSIKTGIPSEIGGQGELCVVSHQVLFAFLGQWDKRIWSSVLMVGCIWYEFRVGRLAFLELFRDGLATASRVFIHGRTRWNGGTRWEALRLCSFFFFLFGSFSFEFYLLHGTLF